MLGSFGNPMEFAGDEMRTYKHKSRDRIESEDRSVKFKSRSEKLPYISFKPPELILSDFQSKVNIKFITFRKLNNFEKIKISLL
jgi:hypothetical protein